VFGPEAAGPRTLSGRYDREGRLGTVADIDWTRIVTAATRAPSIHNTQPWRFVVSPGGIELHLDRDRILTVVDPTGREATLSCGAALLHLRIALAVARLRTETALLPDPTSPDLLARVRVAGTVLGPDRTSMRLDAGALHRRTNRRAFAPEPVPADVVEVLLEEAAQEGATLQVVDTAYEQSVLGWLTRAARDAQEASSAYRSELRQWTAVPETREDGVPAPLLPESGPRASEGVVNRTFDAETPVGLPSDAETGGTLFVLSTEGDTRADWLRAGQALSRVLLEVTSHGFVAHPLSQAVEVPSVRAELKNRLDLAGEPQLLLRVGLATTTGRTPRRTLEQSIGRDGP